MRRRAEVESGQPKAGAVGQRRCTERQWRHHGNFSGCQLGREGVFLENLRVAPAASAIELDDHRRSRQAPQPIDTILVAVECKDVAVRIKTCILGCRKHGVGRKSGKRRRIGTSTHGGRISCW